jgi:hypothetical protein
MKDEGHHELPVQPSVLRSTDNGRTWIFAAASMAAATRVAELAARADEMVVKVIQINEEEYIAVIQRRRRAADIRWVS